MPGDAYDPRSRANNFQSYMGEDYYQFSNTNGRPGQPGQPPQPGSAEYTRTGNDSGGPWDTNVPQNWQPDYSYSSPQARAWLQQNKQMDGTALKLDSNGMYTVAFGDSLSTIAQRELQESGNSAPTAEQIKAEQNAIAQANDNHYPSLDTKPDYLKTGWKLNIPGLEVHRNPDGSTPGQTGQGDGPQCTWSQGDQRNYYGDHGHHGNTYNFYINGNAYFNGGPNQWGLGERQGMPPNMSQYENAPPAFYSGSHMQSPGNYYQQPYRYNTYYTYDPASAAGDAALAQQAAGYAQMAANQAYRDSGQYGQNYYPPIPGQNGNVWQPGSTPDVQWPNGQGQVPPGVRMLPYASEQGVTARNLVYYGNGQPQAEMISYNGANTNENSEWGV